MKTNLTLIGMPGAGKSTVGIVLAKNMGLSFIDTDILIQINNQKTLQEILDESDHMNLRTIEEKEILKINIRDHVISTGGSVAYSDKSMIHLQTLSTIIHLDASFDTIEKRIKNFETRGIAKDKDQTFKDLYDERQRLYRKYADITVDTDGITQDEVAAQIEKAVGRE
ncbi:shikimate kinase [Desulfospira joergensenii]|uniref:shikimate kinase n=1 Tax=Desulfospira joergensenii TaxID=53329 RepID=UPI0003B5CE8A|nr:shikimate kinase [Desulfospira joergensenii]